MAIEKAFTVDYSPGVEGLVIAEIVHNERNGRPTVRFYHHPEYPLDTGHLGDLRCWLDSAMDYMDKWNFTTKEL